MINLSANTTDTMSTNEPLSPRNVVCHFLDLKVYKTEECTVSVGDHNQKRCPQYHDVAKDRRRKLGTYRTQLCEYIRKKKACPNKDACNFAHNSVEVFYHPEKYKAKFCSSYTSKSGVCEYGDYCAFAHSEEEISINLIEKMERDDDFYMFHFKTVWCPYNENSHERDACVYAHNWQDFRRKVEQYPYKPSVCGNWDQKLTIEDYTNACS